MLAQHGQQVCGSLRASKARRKAGPGVSAHRFPFLLIESEPLFKHSLCAFGGVASDERRPVGLDFPPDVDAIGGENRDPARQGLDHRDAEVLLVGR